MHDAYVHMACDSGLLRRSSCRVNALFLVSEKLDSKFGVVTIQNLVRDDTIDHCRICVVG